MYVQRSGVVPYIHVCMHDMKMMMMICIKPEAASTKQLKATIINALWVNVL